MPFQTLGIKNVGFEMTKLASLAKSFILQMYNCLWLRNFFHEEQHNAIIISNPNPLKDQHNVNSYRLISLTHCICIMLEKTVMHDSYGIYIKY